MYGGSKGYADTAATRPNRSPIHSGSGYLDGGLACIRVCNNGHDAGPLAVDLLSRSFAFISPISRRARLGISAISAICGLSRHKAIQTISSPNASRIFRDFNLVAGNSRGPRQSIKFVGLEYLLRALELKHGAVLWMADFVEAGDITKIGLHSRGLPISHLSRPEHGFGGSRFAIKFGSIPFARATRTAFL